MPKDFIKCQAEHGHVITEKLPKGKYRHVCWDADGKPHYGEVKKKKDEKRFFEKLRKRSTS